MLPLDWISDRETSVGSTSFLVRFLFSMSSLESTECRNLAQRLHTDDCFRGSHLSLRSFLLGSGSVAELGCAEYAAVNTASAQRFRNVGPLADLAVRSA